jgi:uncharacterized protein (DUF488 family)
MILYTIGFAQKSAQEFFELLRQNGVRRVVDIRLRPSGQPAGFARKEDLPYFLKNLADGCEYIHLPELTPTKEILDGYRSGGAWSDYERQFQSLMDERKIPTALDRESFELLPSCLLCSEATPEQCHRRLVAERLQARWPNVEIIHL